MALFSSSCFRCNTCFALLTTPRHNSVFLILGTSFVSIFSPYFMNLSYSFFLHHCFILANASLPFYCLTSFIIVYSSPLIHHRLFEAICSSLFLCRHVFVNFFCPHFLVSILSSLILIRHFFITDSSSSFLRHQFSSLLLPQNSFVASLMIFISSSPFLCQ